MSEQPGLSPAEFHRHDGVDAWRVTPHGAEAVFRASSLAEAAGLVAEVVGAAVRDDLQPDIDLRPEAIIVRVPFVGDRLPAATGRFAATVSAAAEQDGLRPDPDAVQAINLFVAEHEDAATRSFWTAVLGYRELGEGDAVDPLRRGPLIAVNPIDNGKRGRGRTHVDVFMAEDVARARVEAALAAGGRLVDDSYAPKWWTLASPDNHGVDVASWIDTWEG
jgi:hypothetical protein